MMPAPRKPLDDGKPAQLPAGESARPSSSEAPSRDSQPAETPAKRARAKRRPKFVL